jgi:glycosyltransferase involved in cell wall biosynthesis
VVIHDLISLHSPFQHRAQTLYLLLLLPRILAAAEHVVFISESVRNEVAGHLGAWVLRKSTVIPSFSHRLTHPLPEPAEREQDLHLFVGARYRHKNLGVVLQAFQQLNLEKPRRLKVVGFAPEVWGETLGQLFPKGLPDWLLLEDYCPGGELQRLYRRAAALIYPSLAEGQGLPPLEAMAAGMPVICSDIPVLRETCGDASLFFSPDSATDLAAAVGRLEAMRQENRLTPLLDAGRNQLAGFSRESIQARWRGLLERIADQTKAKNL